MNVLLEHIQKNRLFYSIAFICVIVVVLSARGITDENVIEMNGDMQKYLMNGAFFYDFSRDMPLSDPFGYAYRYFAKYPALSLGHHPLLLGIAEVPFYYLFGISVFSARLTIICFALLAAVCWYLLVRSLYGDSVGMFATLLFITAPSFVHLSRISMSEMPTIALIVLSAYLLLRYISMEKAGYIYAFAVVFSISVYSKHTAVLMLPIFLVYFLIMKGYKKLFSREVLKSSLIMLLVILPLVPLTLKFSQHNTAWVKAVASTMAEDALLIYYEVFLVMWEAYASPAVWLLGIISTGLLLFRRDRKSSLFILWVAGLYLLFTHIGAPTPRHTVYYIPALCLLAAVIVYLMKQRIMKAVFSALIVVIIGYQFTHAFQNGPAHSAGYEDAARYVVENKKGESVLYSGVYDTGYFIFFIRKHNPEGDLIVLRADKILATSQMGGIVEELLGSSEEIYKVLKNYGVRFVVIEDTDSGSQSLEWLRDEVKSDNFILSKQIIIDSSNPKVHNVPLSIYEFKGYSAPEDGQILKMNIPLMGDSIELPFKDVLRVK